MSETSAKPTKPTQPTLEAALDSLEASVGAYQRAEQARWAAWSGMMRVLPDRTYPPSTGWRRQWQCWDAMAHPAKMSVHLCRDLFTRYTRPGQTIIDPFGGAGTSMVGCLMGRRVLLCELEQRFVSWCDLSWERMRKRVRALRRGTGTVAAVDIPLESCEVIQCDSRHLPLPSASLDVAAGSPPYEESLPKHSRERGHTGDGLMRAKKDYAAYGTTDGQIGALPHDHDAFLREGGGENDGAPHGVVTSPVYGRSNLEGLNDMTGTERGQLPREVRNRRRLVQGYLDGDTRRAHNSANIANLPHDGVDGALTSPAYGEAATYQRAGAGGEGWELMRAGLPVEEIAEMRRRGDPRVLDTRRGVGYSRSGENIGNLPHEGVDSAITSPAFGEMNARHAGGDVGGLRPNKDGVGFEGEDDRLNFVYSEEANNIGNLRMGDVDGAIGSPPYVDARQGWPTPEGAENIRYGATDGQIGGLGHGDISAAITSSPYADVASRNRSQEGYAAKHPEHAREYGRSADQANRSIDGYGSHPANIGNLVRGDATWISPTPAPTAASPAGLVGAEPVGRPTPTGSCEPPSTTERSDLPRRGGSVSEAPATPTGRAVMPGGEGMGGEKSTQPPSSGTAAVSCAGAPPANWSPTTSSGGRTAGQPPSTTSSRSARGATGASTTPAASAATTALIAEPGTSLEVPAPEDASRARPSTTPHEWPSTGNGGGEEYTKPAPTYASEMLQCYREMYRVIRPGGVLVTVVGNYVRDGKEVRLDEDTIKLCVAAGWIPVERWKHAKAAVSFWRHLHRQRAAQRGLEGAPEINEEHVLVFVKEYQGWDFADLPETRKPKRTSAKQAALALDGVEVA